MSISIPYVPPAQVGAQKLKRFERIVLLSAPPSVGVFEALLSSLPAAFTRRQASGMSAALLERLTAEETLERFAHGLYVDERDALIDLDLAAPPNQYHPKT